MRSNFNSEDGVTRITVETGDEFVGLDEYDRPRDWKNRRRSWRSTGSIGVPHDLIAKVALAMVPNVVQMLKDLSNVACFFNGRRRAGETCAEYQTSMQGSQRLGCSVCQARQFLKNAGVLP